MKKILAQIPIKIDEIFGQHSAAAQRAANRLRWFYGALFLIATLWNFSNDGLSQIIYPLLTLLWFLSAFVFGLRAKTNLTSNGIFAVWIDVAILSLGLGLCAMGGVFNTKGWLILLCYFPVIALLATRSNLLLIIQVAVFLIGLYAMLSMYTIGSLALPRLLTIVAMTMATIALTNRPKKELTEVLQKVAQDAYQLGANEKEAELTAFVHAQSFPPLQYNLPGLYAAYKHGVGTVTSGDFYTAFETAKGPMVVIGDLTGNGLNAALVATEVQQQIRKLAHEKATLTEIALEFNEVMWRKKQLVSCVLARWEGANLQYLNAGHLPGIHISKREPELLAAHPVRLGASETLDIAEETLVFPKGDVLLLYTDGAYSGLAQDPVNGAQEILRLVKQFSNGEVNTLCHRVFDCGLPEYKQLQDDSTVVIVRRQEIAGEATA